MDTSTWIAAGALLVSVVTLLYIHAGLRQTSRAVQLQVFESIFREIRRLDAEYQVEFREKNIAPNERWCFEFFNTTEYLAYLINHKMVRHKELYDFYEPGFLAWDQTFGQHINTSIREDPNKFREFKKLVARIRSRADKK